MDWLGWAIVMGTAAWVFRCIVLHLPLHPGWTDDWRKNPDIYNTPDNPFTDGQPKGKIRPRD